MYSGKWLTADEARAIGLVNYVVDNDALHDEAMASAAKLTERSRLGLAEMKRLAPEGLGLCNSGAMALEAVAAARHIADPAATEGLAAFEARRKISCA